MPFSTIEEAILDIKNGKMIIVVDDEDRENEGDLTMAAEKVTPEAINFMAKYGRGLICLPMTAERLEELQIPMMVADNTSTFETAFTVSIEAKRNVTTGISAKDRATTILTAIDPKTKPEDLARPGHIFPLRARKGGVLERAGQTEAAVDLARIAGLYPAGVICEIMKDDGTMARLPDLKKFAEKFGLKIISIADLIEYRLKTEKFVKKIAESDFPTEFGKFKAIVFENMLTKRTHLVLKAGEIKENEPIYVRVHTQSVQGDVFSSLYNPSGKWLKKCMKFIQEKGKGVILYLRLEPDEKRLLTEIKTYAEISKNGGTFSFPDKMFEKEDRKDYGIGAQILSSLGAKKLILLTNHPRKYSSLKGYGIEIVKQIKIDDL